MKASNNFLKMYVKNLDVSGKEFSEKITLTGTKVETYEQLDKNLFNIVVAKIIKIEKHPDADKLVVCKVDIGNEVVQIVTGAKNVYEGMICPAVLPNGKVATSHNKNLENGILIKKSKLRGVESFGMLCSIEELGRPNSLYTDVDGIFDMSNYDCKIGDDAISVLDLYDTVYDFEITSNRIDCYSIIGIAKEVAATFNLQFLNPNTNFKTSFKDSEYIKIDIKNKNLCQSFSTRLIKNVKIKESPEWLKNKLRAVGIRPINNFVDITNFVMVEYGQPMHAYDYKTINGKKIIVKTADSGEKFTTLDGKERILDNTMLTINDDKKILGIAGVMGGENSMITEGVTDVLLESANFDGFNIRVTSKKLGLRTEASNLFEKGLDPNNSIKALDRACALIYELGIGDISDDSISVGFDLPKEKTISVEVKKINDLLGTNIDKNEMKNILDKIDLLTEIKNDTLFIKVPTIRKDINNFADISEEIVRFFGYDNVNLTFDNVHIIPKLESSEDLVDDSIYDVLINNGFCETMNYSFESKKVYEKLMYDENDFEMKQVKILNPLGEDFSIMRTQLMNGLFLSLSNNFKKQNKNVKLFELANIYIKNDNEELLPIEKKVLSFGAYGDNIDFFYVKLICEKLLNKIGIYNIEYSDINIKYNFLHPYRRASVYINDTYIGYIGEANIKTLKNYDIEQNVSIGCLYIDDIYKFSNFNKKYTEISKFPSVERDLSLIIKKDLPVLNVYKIIKNNSSNILSHIDLYDIYEGSQLPEGYKSITYNLTFSSLDHTLVDSEVDEIIEKIIKKLKEIGVEIRK